MPLQAAIADSHMQAHVDKDADWDKLVALYNALLKINPAPVESLNRAPAVSMAREEIAEKRLKQVENNAS